MAKKQQSGSDQQKPGSDAKEHSEGLLVEAAKAIGGLAGKVAAAVGGGEASPAQKNAPRKTSGKLQPKNKARLPRREKKARKKAASRVAA
jgi:hypothetical protein